MTGVALQAIDAAIERARQSARRTEQAAKHSLRSASQAQRAQQRATADKAAAHLADLEYAREAFDELAEAARSNLRGSKCPCSYCKRLELAVAATDERRK